MPALLAHMCPILFAQPKEQKVTDTQKKNTDFVVLSKNIPPSHPPPNNMSLIQRKNQLQKKDKKKKNSIFPSPPTLPVPFWCHKPHLSIIPLPQKVVKQNKGYHLINPL